MFLSVVAAALAAGPVNVELVLDEDLQALGLDEAQLEEAMENAANEQMRLPEMGQYLAQMADANVLSAKGLGVDYASNMQRFAVGGGFGSAVNEGGFRFVAGEEPLPDTGFAFQISAMAGLNLGVFSKEESALRRVKLYVNGMKASTQRDPFTGTFLNYGGHLQIKLIGGAGDQEQGVAEWGGIDVTAGYEYSSYTLQLAQDFPISSGDLAWTAEGTYEISSEVQSVPLEVSTNFRVLVVSVFGGAGFDYNLSGRADNEIEVGGPLTYTYEGKAYEAGSATATMNASGFASEYTPRVFAGAQVNVFLVKLYGQLNVTFDRSVGGHLGVRAVM
ncbi:MAG: Lsa36 family surface (lipo)protein [Myxococcota bacterium]